MAGIGAALIFGGLFLCYDAYKAIHNHTGAAPLKSAQAALNTKAPTTTKG